MKRILTMKLLLIYTIFMGCFGLVLSFVAHATIPENTVTRIIDGDTVEIRGANNKTLTVRLLGIDAPENGQAYGKKSTKALSNLVYKKQVKFKGNQHDKYGRLLSRLYVDELDISEAMISQGAAWVYRRYTRDRVLYKAEATAKQHKNGLWAKNNPVPPWDWRQK
jgi:endonuclease YncB( thermonuclease family)